MMRTALLLLLGLISLLLGLARAEAERPPLTLGFMPYLNAEHLLEKYQPLADYLSRQLQREVRITVAKDYEEHIRLTGEDRLDIAFLGGMPYVAITQQYGPKPLLARYEFSGEPNFRSVVFVSRNSPLRSLAELEGKRIALGSARSTLSSQVPIYMLRKAGIRLDQLAAHEHLRNHENVLYGVALGDFDAGGVAEEVYREFAKGGGVRALAHSEALSTHLFVTRKDMPEDLRQNIAQALLQLKSRADGELVLGAIGASLTGFVPVKDSDYDTHRKILAVVQDDLKH